jgi:ABC-2 type transport system ATP-binding protein
VEPVIQVENLTKSYAGIEAIERVSFCVRRGEVFGLLGANGAGKSTTIECMLGTRKQDSGSVSILGMNPQTERKALFEMVGVQFQESHYQDKITVRELCEETQSLYKAPSDYEDLLRKFGLADKRKSPVGELSGGQRQRLFITLALIPNPKVVFLDEPTGGVDPVTRRQFWELIYAAAGRGITVFVTTHYMDEAEYCDRISMMVDGRIEALDSPANLRASYNVDSMDDVFQQLARKAIRKGD